MIYSYTNKTLKFFLDNNETKSSIVLKNDILINDDLLMGHFDESVVYTKSMFQELKVIEKCYLKDGIEELMFGETKDIINSEFTKAFYPLSVNLSSSFKDHPDAKKIEDNEDVYFSISKVPIDLNNSTSFLINNKRCLVDFMEDEYKNENFTDFEIVVVDKNTSKEYSYKAHKAVLSMGSDIMNEMIKGSDGKKINLNVDNNTFPLVLKYIYTYKIELRPSHLQEIVLTCEKIGLESLIHECFDFYIKSVNETNVIYYLMIGIKDFQIKDIEVLKDKMMNILKSNADSILKTKDIYLMDEELVRNIVRSDDLLCNEYEIYKFIVEWSIHYSKQKEVSEKELMKSLVKFIR
jgi:hypothetical protein